MNPITMPNLPDGDVKVVIIDGRCPKTIRSKLEQSGIKVILTEPHPGVYDAVSYHPDIMLHHIDNNLIVYAPGTSRNLVESLSQLGFNMLEGQTELGFLYPMTIAYNVARVGKYAFHNLKYTDPLIKELLYKRGIELVNVKQGYSKCLTCVVNSESIITSDAGICKKAQAVGLDVLLIEPDKSIRLDPFDMGFIGGASGLIGKNKLAFTGNLYLHKNCNEILDFLRLKNVDVVMLNDEPLLDLGTIIPII